MTRSPSHLGATLRLVATGLRRRAAGKGQPAAPAPGRRLAVERTGISADRERVRRYLVATRGAERSGARDLLPPTYTAVWETALTLELLGMDGVPFPRGGVVHLGGELVAVRPMALDETHLRLRVELERIEVHRRGCTLVLRSRVWGGGGHLCQENSTRLLLVGVAPPAGSLRRGRERGERPEEEAEWREVASWKLGPDAGRRYARASGDYNPIHLWAWSARLLGFARPILHGHCALAMMAHELERLTGRTPRRLSVDFRRPIELPARVRLEAAGAPESGRAVLRLLDVEGEGKAFLEGSWVAGTPRTRPDQG